MKINIRAAFMLSAFALLLTFASAGFGQIVGGYKLIANDDQTAKSAATFAVNAQSAKSQKKYELSMIAKAERQIVAGSNYRLCMKVSESGADESYVQAVVYVDLKNNPKLTSWTASACGGAAADGFKPVEKDHAGAGLAADFAVKEKSKTMKPGYQLEEVASAEIQEGTGSKMGSANYRDCIRVSLNGKSSMVLTVVSMDQYSNFKLISWADGNCVSMEAPASAADGYEPADKDNAGITMAADFAVKKHSEDTKVLHTVSAILKGETKGMLAVAYRICMNVAEEGKTHTIQAVVSMDQYSNMKLVSWEHSTICNK